MARYTRLIGIALAVALIVVVVLPVWRESTLQTLVKDLPKNYLLFTGALGALGTITMGVIQTIKDLVPVLRWYQELKTRIWLRLKAAEAAEVALTAQTAAAVPQGAITETGGNVIDTGTQQFSPREVVKKRLVHPSLAPELRRIISRPFNEADEDVAIDAEADLLRLATAGNRIAFYDLPIEKLCGQMNAASQIVLDYPDQHEALLKCLASLATPQDRALFGDPTLRSELARLRQRSIRTPAEEQRILEIQQLLAESRSRIANQIHRSVDAFQIHVGDRWQWYLRLASFMVSFLITAGALRIGVGSAVPTMNGSLDDWAVIVLIGLIGGFLAPVASDIQAIVRQFRQTP